VCWNKWWKSRAPKSEIGPLCHFYTDAHELISVWALGRLSAVGARPQVISEDIETEVAACTECGRWDPAARSDPIDVVIRSTTRTGRPITRRTLKNLWTQNPIGSPVATIRADLLESLGPKRTQTWVIGKVLLEGSGEVEELRSYFDTRTFVCRSKHTRNWFKNHGSARCEACQECGAFTLSGTMGGSYSLASDIDHNGAHEDSPGFVVPKSVSDELELTQRRKWPLGHTWWSNTYDVLLDPIGRPYPKTWDEFEADQAKHVPAVPFPKCHVPDGSNPGTWLQEKIDTHGYKACVGDKDLNGSYLDETTRLVFFTRLRAMWEPHVRAHVKNLTDDQLAIDILEHKIAASDRGEGLSYLP